MSTNKKFRIQNGVDIHGGGLSIDDVTVIGADGKVVQSAIADAVAGLTSSDIADLQAQVSAILGTSPETLDTLQEIVAAFESADNSLTASVAANTTAHTQNASDIAATNARTAGISTSSGSSNIQMAADVDMDGNALTNVGSISAAGQGMVFGGNQHGNWISVYDSLFAYDGLFTYGNTTGIYTELTYLGYRGRTNADGEYTDRISMYGQFYSHGDIDMGASGSNKKVKNLLDPTAAQDAATKAYVDAVSTSSGSDLATETAARIAGDAANSNEISVETARAGAVESSLQSQIDSEQSARIAADSQLQTNITAEEAARIGADQVLQNAIDAEAATRASADNTLQSNIDTVSAAVSAITSGSPEQLNQLVELVSAYEAADSDLQTLISNLGGDASALTARVSTLETEMDSTEGLTASNAAAILQEVSDRAAAVTAVQGAVDTEATVRAAAVSAEASARASADTAEENARILADNGLQAQIDALDTSTGGDIANLQAQITSNDNDIASLESSKATVAALNTEVARATAAESALDSDISVNAAGIATNAAAIAQEVIDRTTADAALQSQIDFIEANTDPAALDSLSEIVAAFQAADSSTLGVVNSNTSRIAALEGAQAGILAWNTDNVSEGSTNLYFTEARAKACVGADAGSCLDYDQAAGKFSLDLTETAGALVPDNSTNADKLDGQHGSHYRIDVYDVNGTVVN